MFIHHQYRNTQKCLPWGQAHACCAEVHVFPAPRVSQCSRVRQQQWGGGTGAVWETAGVWARGMGGQRIPASRQVAGTGTSVWQGSFAGGSSAARGKEWGRSCWHCGDCAKPAIEVVAEGMFLALAHEAQTCLLGSCLGLRGGACFQEAASSRGAPGWQVMGALWSPSPQSMSQGMSDVPCLPGLSH